jgi:hypothetical protein
METTFSSPTTLKTPADYEAAIDSCLMEMTRLRALMNRDQEEIDRLRDHTRAVLRELKGS